MGKLHRISRVGILATGLGVGAAMAAMPAVATADALDSADIAAYLPDFGAVAAAAASITPPTVPDDFSNYAISFSGIPLYQTGSAFAESSFGNIAIAHGASTYALAYGGLFNTANVDGDGSAAEVGTAGSLGFPVFNTATVTGAHSVAQAAYGVGSGSYNTATVTGNFSTAYAGTASGGLPTGSFNSATAEGYQAHAAAGLDGSSGNAADANGDLITSVSPGAGGAAAEPSGAATGVEMLNDSAAATAAATPATLPDDYSNFAVSISGLNLISIGHASAESSFGNVAIAHGLYSDANAMSGFFNYATTDGDHSTAVVGDTGSFNYASATGLWSSAAAAWGSGNTAVSNGDYAIAQAGAGDGTAIYDSNFNTATAEGSHAIALAGWDSSSNHVASAIGDNVHVYDPMGSPVGFPAAESSLAELLNSFSAESHAAADSGNWLADLFPALDGGSAAAESSNWLTELLASFDGGSVAADGANFWTELTTLF